MKTNTILLIIYILASMQLVSFSNQNLIKSSKNQEALTSENSLSNKQKNCRSLSRYGHPIGFGIHPQCPRNYFRHSKFCYLNCNGGYSTDMHSNICKKSCNWSFKEEGDICRNKNRDSYKRDSYIPEHLPLPHRLIRCPDDMEINTKDGKCYCKK